MTSLHVLTNLLLLLLALFLQKARAIFFFGFTSSAYISKNLISISNVKSYNDGICKDCIANLILIPANHEKKKQHPLTHHVRDGDRRNMVGSWMSCPYPVSYLGLKKTRVELEWAWDWSRQIRIRQVEGIFLYLMKYNRVYYKKDEANVLGMVIKYVN